ncbi:MAG: SRPBCC family protein [Candidatus Promineifilaceae bacterium]
MIEFENTIVIQRPVEEVFAFVSDFENVPKWNYYVQQVARTSSGPAAVAGKIGRRPGEEGRLRKPGEAQRAAGDRQRAPSGRPACKSVDTGIALQG